MKYGREHHRRRSIRLEGYDYAGVGAYFVTICTQDRAPLFGEIVNGEMRLNGAGGMIHTVWDEIPAFYPDVGIDEFVVMPNHIHGIVLVGAAPRGHPDCDGNVPSVQPRSAQPGSVQPPLGQPRGVAPTLSLPDVVHRFKVMTTKRYVGGVKQSNWPPFRGRLWQRNYYEHIIRSDESLNRIRQYIRDNPMRWAFDHENPAATAPEPGDASPV